MKKKSIFIVEDEALIVMELTDRLKRLGYDVCGFALSGEEAVEKIAELRPDLVLLDIRLAGKMDGIEAAKQVRGRFNLPIIYLTAYADEQTLEDAKTTEPAGYLMKPFEENDLHISIEVALYRHSMEKKLRESELRYRTLFEGAGDAIFILDAEGDNAGLIVDANLAAAEMHGYSIDELRGLNIRDLDAPDAAIEAPRLIERMLKEEWIKKEIEHRRKDGTVFPVEISAGLLVLDEHKYILAIDRDVTERRKGEEALKTALMAAEGEKNKTEAIIAAMGDGISIQDTGFRVLYQNEVHKEIIGDHIGEYCYKAYERNEDVCEGCGIALSFRDGRIHKVERNAMTDRGMIYVEVTASPVRDSSGKIVAGIEIVRDISERKRYEKTLNRMNRALRTLSKCNEVLVRAKSEEDLLRDGCQTIVTEGGYRMAWVGYAEHDEARTVRPVQGCGHDEKYLETVKMSWADTEYGLGPTGTAIRSGKHVVVQNVQTDPGFALWRDEAVKRGYASIIGLPLKTEKSVLGALTIYAVEPDAFDNDEVELLSELAEDISFGISSIRSRKARLEAEEQLRRNYYSQTAINEILRFSLSDVELHTILQRTLDLILGIPWLSVESRGAIFLADNKHNELVMETQKGLDEHIRQKCASVPLGTCLCGGAALKQKIIFSKSIDDRHEILYEGILPHGHYCVPIVSANRTLGVINLYLREGHPEDEKEKEFLSATANVLAGVIQRKQAEEERETLFSELQQTFDKVSRSQKEWRDTFDSITDLIYITDTEYNLLKANRAFAEYCGMTPRGVISKKCYELFHKSIGVPEECPHAISMRELRLVQTDFVDRRTNRTFLMTAFPYFGDGGVLVGSIVVGKDVTAEKENEMRLIMSERLASLGQMASGIAHEINNPLAAIAGCTEGLLKRVELGRFEPELFRNYLQIIGEEILRCKDITSGMLSFVRKTTYDTQDIDIHKALDKTIEIIGFQGRLKEVELVKDYAEVLPLIRGSEGEIRQVFLTIIINALDAMEGRGKLMVSTGVEDKTVFVKITDTGPGIAPEHFSRIFDPFYTTKGEMGGTGLGLSIANKIIINHNGSIEVSSEKDKGTTFVITLPS